MAFQQIADRVVNVAMKLGNRQDLLVPAPASVNTYSRIAGWLRDAYVSTSYSQSFHETEQTITFATVQGQDTYDYPGSVRAIKSLVGVNQNTGAPIIVEWKDIEYVRRYSTAIGPANSTIFGTPSIVAPWGTTLIFRPVPDSQAYLFYLDCWMKPVITADVVSTELALPDDWLEVVDYSATIRGHVELMERDKANEISKLVYGYTDPASGQKVHGIVDRLGNRNQAQAPYKNWGLQPKYAPRYTGK